MLGKLTKYEFQATQRVFLPLYGLILALAALIRLFTQFNLQEAEGVAILPFVITTIVYGILIAAVCVMTLVVTVQRFQKNLLGDEGYLSFTLPVKPHSHIDSKMIVSFVWNILSFAISAVSVAILAYDGDFSAKWVAFWRSVRQWFHTYGAVSHVLVWECIVLAVVLVLTGILQLYASTIVGNLSSKHKLLAGFGAFIGFSVVETVAASFLTDRAANIVVHISQSSGWFDTSTASQQMWAAAAVIGFALIFTLVFGLLFYFLTEWMLRKKLNLE